MDKQLIIEAAKTADQCLGYLAHFCVYGSKINISSIKENFPSVFTELENLYLECNGVVPYEPGYIYLINAVGSNYFKIGLTKNPRQRIKQISPKMPFETEYVLLWRTLFMHHAEKYLHDYFEECRANGEWFLFKLEKPEEDEDSVNNIWSSFPLFDPTFVTEIKYSWAFDLITRIRERDSAEWYKFRSWLDDQGFLFDSYDYASSILQLIEAMFDEFCCQEQTKKLNQLLGSEVSA